MSSSSRTSTSTIIGTVAATVAVGTLGYLAWFDYQRRNNLEFRRELLKDKRKVERAATVEARNARVAQSEQLKNAVRQMQNDPIPSSVEEKEAFFLEQVAIGEALAARGEAFYIPAAISFFKGLQVYPQPQELLMIYQRTQPAQVVALLMDALRLSIELEGGRGSSSSSGGGRGGSSGGMRSGAILEEIDTEGEEKQSRKSPTSSSATSSRNGQTSSAAASSPGAKSYVDVEYPTSSDA